MDTKYNPAAFQATHRHGNRVTAVRNGRYITRNISFFKKLLCPEHGGPSQLMDVVSEDNYSSDYDVDEMVEQMEPVRYPVRRRQRVQRFGNNIYD